MNTNTPTDQTTCVMPHGLCKILTEIVLLFAYESAR